jgi:hypothetical protein
MRDISACMPIILNFVQEVVAQEVGVSQKEEKGGHPRLRIGNEKIIKNTIKLSKVLFRGENW